MAKISKLGFAVLLGLGLAISASGQGRGFSAPMRGFSAPTRSLPSPVRSFSRPVRGSMVQSFSGVGRGSIPRAGRGVFRSRTFAPQSCTFTGGLCVPVFIPPQVVTATPQEPNFGIVNGVPGLGFDFPHLAAINRGFNSQFGFFNALNNGFGNNGFIFPFFGGLPFYNPPYEEVAPDYYTEGAQQPRFAVPSPQQPATLPPAETAPRESATPQAPPPPPPELGQLILVRRDGQVLMAVAFTTNHGQLTYITREGVKRSFPLSDLDKDATRQMNDANGTSVSLPE